jgi:hypothetical protein
MARRSLILLSMLALLFGAISCEKLPMGPGAHGALKTEPAKFSDAIPAEYGDLVGVVINPRAPTWAALWFQRLDKSIVVTRVNTGDGRMADQVLVIPRR